jgi:hypothetical protein
MRRTQAGAALAMWCVICLAAQESSVQSIYVDLQADRCAASPELVLQIDSTPASISRVTKGPHPVSAVVLFDTSPSMPLVPVENIARRMSLTAQPDDRFVMGSFGPKVMFAKAVFTDQGSASRAVREVTQKRTGQGGPSPLWDALYESASMQMSAGSRAVVVFTDARASGNDKGFAEAYDQLTFAGVAVIAVGVGDDALPRNSNMYAAGRNDALRKLAKDTTGFYTELSTAKSAPPYAFLVDSLRNIRHRCRIDFALPAGDRAVHRLTLTSANVPVPAPLRIRAR